MMLHSLSFLIMTREAISLLKYEWHPIYIQHTQIQTQTHTHTLFLWFVLSRHPIRLLTRDGFQIKLIMN